MAFDWMNQTRSPRRRAGDRDKRIDMYRQELEARAGLLSRLGYPPSRAISRLVANVKWDFEIGAGSRPSALSDKAISEIVKSAYLRRPAR